MTKKPLPELEYRCTNGHDRCEGSLPGVDCQYCEVRTVGTAYRYVDVQYAAGVSESGDPEGSGSVGIDLREYRVVRRTPQGIWIMGDEGEPKFVNLTKFKKFACETKQEAMESFLARKATQRRILNAQLERVRKAIEAARGVVTT